MHREMDVARLQAYIMFSSQHIDALSKEELNEMTEVSFIIDISMT